MHFLSHTWYVCKSHMWPGVSVLERPEEELSSAWEQRCFRNTLTWLTHALFTSRPLYTPLLTPLHPLPLKTQAGWMLSGVRFEKNNGGWGPRSLEALQVEISSEVKVFLTEIQIMTHSMNLCLIKTFSFLIFKSHKLVGPKFKIDQNLN